MACEAEEQIVVQLRHRKRAAAHRVQLETATAELDALTSNAHIYDWGAVRLAEAFMRCWDSRCAQAEDALARCKERKKQERHSTTELM